MKTTTIKEQYLEYKAQNPNARIYDISCALQVSEMELLEIAESEKLVYLGNDFKGILKDLETLGKVMALTRNEHAVHETKGIYGNVSFMENAPMGIAHNEIIDMRYFMSTWAHVYAVVFASGDRTMHSIQIFDKFGDAVHKVYTLPESNLQAYHDLVKKYTKSIENKPTIVSKNKIIPTAKTDPMIDIGAFQTEWLNMKDTHDFFGMINRYGLSRQQAFQLAPPGDAYKIKPMDIVKILEEVAAQQIPIMVFLGNNACLQIYSGLVKKLVQMGNWYNILDPNFNLHLKLDSIEEAWVVKKYTSDGIVTSIELFDKAGSQILYCFGNRKPGIPELDSWRKAVAGLGKL